MAKKRTVKNKPVSVSAKAALATKVRKPAAKAKLARRPSQHLKAGFRPPLNRAESPVPTPGRRIPSAAMGRPMSQRPGTGAYFRIRLEENQDGPDPGDLEHYRQLLFQKRAEILGDVASLQTDSRNNSGGNLSNMPLHMADVGSDNYEQEFTLGLVESDAFSCTRSRRPCCGSIAGFSECAWKWASRSASPASTPNPGPSIA